MANTHAILTTGLLLAVCALPLGGAQSPGTDFVVPAGTRLAVDHPIVADRITIAGTLVRDGPGDLVLTGTTVAILDGAVLQAPDGARGASALALNATGLRGADGGSVRITAQELAVAPTARVQAGAGGAGGSALAALDSRAGAGGAGGSVLLAANDPHVEGSIVPGRGGDGGIAWSLPSPALPAKAFGGAAGPAGAARMNGATLAFNGPERFALDSLARHPAELCVAYQGPKTGEYVVTYASIRTEMADPCTLLPKLTSGTTPAAPGTAGNVTYLCDTPQGAPGQINPGGNGGDGGDACVEMVGSDGSAGDDGSSGWFSCTNGGNGGPGASVASATAQGGDGAPGTPKGGKGGNAKASVKGGDGGNGGNGGTRTFGPDCAGGMGGAGGNTGNAQAIGGSGGAGSCSGGQGGTATAVNHPGSGGAGGAGKPAGPAGTPGTGGTAQAANGQVGIGLNSACPN